MRSPLTAALAAVLAATTIGRVLAATAPDAAQLAPVQRWIDAFNAAQAPLPEDVFTSDAVVTDEFAPFAWSGTAGVHAWSQRVAAGFSSPRIKHEHVAVGAPIAFLQSKAGDRVSFVLPATLTYEQDGTPGTDKALWLFVVVKTSDGWKIAADTWTGSE